MPRPSLLLLLGASALLLQQASADVRLPALISDNMVLLEEAPARIWGWAAPQEIVKVSLAGQTAEASADADGRWAVRFEGLKPGDAGEMTVTGKNTIAIKNVLVGEVWIASGQSNMEWVVANSAKAPDEIATANHPSIRMFTVQKNPQTEPQTDCKGRWEVCTPETVARFSAVGYFFGRHLQGALKVPIGIIHSSWGGTEAELWTPAEVLGADPLLQPTLARWDQAKAAYPKAKADYEAAVAAWPAAVEAAKAAGKPEPAKPRAPRGTDAFGSPGCLYNGMIAPLLPYTIRGAIWYQGESNSGNPKLYQRLFPTMIASWRERWNVGEFPFLFVQLANFRARKDQPADSKWAALREAQTMTLALPHTGMAVAIDIGEADDIHPKNKQEVGRRLGLVAQAAVYYQDVEFAGPLYSSSQAEEGKIRLSFRHADGLKASDGGKLRGFAVAGADGKFQWAEAEIQGDHIVVQSASIPQPIAVRYAWADNPECNLTNNTGLPASPFRTDESEQNEGR